MFVYMYAANTIKVTQKEYLFERERSEKCPSEGSWGGVDVTLF